MLEKTFLAERFASILPPLGIEEEIEVQKIRSFTNGRASKLKILHLRFVDHIIMHRWQEWWGVEKIFNRGSFLSRIGVCCFWMKCLSFEEM